MILPIMTVSFFNELLMFKPRMIFDRERVQILGFENVVGSSAGSPHSSAVAKLGALI